MLWCAGFASVACNLIVIIAKWTDGYSFMETIHCTRFSSSNAMEKRK